MYKFKLALAILMNLFSVYLLVQTVHANFVVKEPMVGIDLFILSVIAAIGLVSYKLIK